MQQREWIRMSVREQRRARVLTRVIGGEVKLWEAAVALGRSGSRQLLSTAELPPTQVGRIHQDRLVSELRLAGSTASCRVARWRGRLDEPDPRSA
jgi:hypothetical protein